MYNSLWTVSNSAGPKSAATCNWCGILYIVVGRQIHECAAGQPCCHTEQVSVHYCITSALHCVTKNVTTFYTIAEVGNTTIFRWRVVTTDSAINYCNRTPIVQVIVQNVDTYFSGWYADIRLMPAVCISGSADAYVCMHRRGRRVDAFQLVTTEHCEGPVSLIHNQPPSLSAATVTAPGRLRPYFTSFTRSRLCNIRWQRWLDEVSRRENSISLLLGTASTADYPLVSVKICSSVIGVVSRHVAAGLRQFDTRRRFITSLSRLQSVMNAVARLIFSSSRFQHIAPLLCQLHWLKAPERIAFKQSVLVYKCLHGSAPAYLTDELCQVADVEARQQLRSSSSSLIVSHTRLITVGDRAFPVAAARVWNSLPDLVTSAPSVAVFRSRLKTHLFNLSYPCDCTVTLVALDTIIILTYLLTYIQQIHDIITDLHGSSAPCQSFPQQLMW